MLIIAFTSMLLLLLSNNVEAMMMDSSTDSTSDAVVILATSTILGQENSGLQGSVMGGTTIYMKVQGLDQTASNNAVYIGKYPCVISDKGVNGLFMNCKTTKPDSDDNNLSSLQIVVKVSGKPDSECAFISSKCLYSYTQYNTPKLSYVSPRSNYPRTLSYWRAKWAVSSTLVQYLEGQFMGENRCDRFTVLDLYPDEINFWDDQVVCQVSAEIKAGYYDYTIKSQSGYQTNDVGVKQKKIYSDRTYDSKIVPIITGINTNFASPEGQILQISGYGFSPIATENTVKITGQSETIQVLSSTPTTINAKIPKLTNLPAATDATDSSVYIQGSGLHYTRWDISGLNLNCATFRTQIITNQAQLDSRIQFDGIYPEPDVLNQFGEYYGQYFRGFLKAPITGNYRFYVASDDCAQFFIQTSQVKMPIRPDTASAASGWNPYRNYWYEYLSYANVIKTISGTVSLQQDEFYYIEAYHLNGGSGGHFTLSMEIESATRKSNSLNSIYEISTSYTPTKEVIEFTLYNSNGNTLLAGKYQLQFTFGTKTTPQTGVYYSYITGDLAPNANANSIKSAIQNCGGGYLVTVTATKVDNTGTALDDAVTVFAGYKYTITFDSHRGTTQYRALPKIIPSLNGGTIVQNIQRTQEPVDPISGTFQLTMTINAVENAFEVSKGTYDLPFDASSSLIADNIERITGQRPFVWTIGRAQDGWKWYIILRSQIEGLTDFSITTNLLVSGGGDVTAAVSKPITDSNNLLFEPIPNELLFTYSKHPQVQVEVQYELKENNVVVETEHILAGCEQVDACDFTLSDEKTPTLTAYSVTGSQLSLTLQEGVGLIVGKSDLEIQYAGADCTNILFPDTPSPYSITCNLEQLNGQNIKEAGDNQVPAVHHQAIGYSKIDAGVTGETINLVISSVLPVAGSPDGGTTITITGTGFPKNLNREFTFQIDGQDVQPLSITNTQIVFVTPKKVSGGTGAISLSFNQKTITSSLFTYDDALRIQVSTLEFNAKTPIFKGLMTITGTNFGTVVDDVKVTLVGTKSYNAKVISVTDTSIQVYLRGGMPGQYRVTITRKDYGISYANADDNLFKYIIPITSVTLEDGTSQAKGSEAGGTVIKITGSNFVQGETIVFVGVAINWICEIDESRFTSEVIFCTVPPKFEFYSDPAQLVVVTLQVTLESTCLDTTNQCKFTYDNTLTPTLTDYPASTTQFTGSRILTENDHQKPDYQKLVQRKRFLWTEESKKQGNDHILNLGKSPRRDMLTSADLVLSQQKTYAPGDTETLSGTGLTSAVSVVFKGPITQTVTATISGASFTYTIPNLPQGQYKTYILTQNGYADKIWVTVIGLSITSIDAAAIGGQLLTINGFGFNAKKSPSVKVGATACTELEIVSSVQLKCRMARQTVTSAAVTISQLPSENNSAVPLTATLTLVITPSSSSPTFTAISGATYDSTQKAYLATAGNIVLVFTGIRLTGTTIVVTLEHMGHKISGTVSALSDTSVTATFSNLPVGVYSINLLVDTKYAYISDVTKQKLIVSASLPTSNNPTASYAGGATVTFTGTGFDSVKDQNTVNICGFNCPINSATYTTLSCEVPKLLTTSVLNQYSALQEPARYIKPSEVTLLADTATSVSSFFDLKQSTYYTSSAATNCFIQVDFGSSRVLKLHQLRYTPRIDKLAIQLKDAVFQYTTDGTTWQTLLTVDQTVHTGWNIYLPQNDITGIKAIRLFDSRGSTGSSCQLAEIELKGWILSNSNNAYSVPTSCNAEIQVNGQALGTVSNAVSYTSTSVPIVNSVSPATGRFTEEAVITITGTGFVDGQTTVTIDGVTCAIQSVSATQIVCKTGVKDLEQTQLNGVFQVRVNGNLAVNNQKFIYATKWSDINTWGGYEYPGNGDSVIVNAGQTLIVDVKTPKLMQVLVEGTLTFSDELDTSMDAHFIVIREGKFNIGTELVAHQHKVQITLYGVEEDVQMPAMGNKVLGCHQCQLTIHGKERTPTWTLLSTTVLAGAIQITVDDAVDWQIGEQIVITSSEVEHMQSEKRYISAVSVDKKTLTLDQPLTFKHFSAAETYGTDIFPMKVEVGLLTRNIVIQGEESDLKYGYHLMIHGRAEKGAIGKISYAEFRYGGQPRIIGRYPVHFHLNGEVDESYVVGNSIHDCYARCLTIHGVHYLKVQKNVCYNTFGHAIFFEDGIETNNVIEDNLVASTKQSWIMLQTDITVATYWVTNPQNILRRNRSGGSEWYGFWYEIKTNPDGPSATSDICPPGLNILEFKDNWSHSNGRFGLRIFQMAPRKFPCINPENWANDQPYIDNPSLQAVFEKFYTWKNNECGILGEELGNIYFKDIMIADSKFAGFQAHKGNFSAEGAVLDNALIVGKSINNANPDNTYYDGSRAMVVPRTNGFLAKNIRIYNYGSNSALIESCSVCWNMKLWVQGGKNTQFINVKAYFSESANRIFWQKHRREIFWDQDGSISDVAGGAYIIPYKKHIDGIPGCVHHPEAFWDNSIICAMNQVTIRDVLVNSPTPAQDFSGTDMKLYRLDSTNVALKMDPLIDENKFIEGEVMKIIKKSHDVKQSFASVFATGFTYNVHFKLGASDPLSMGIFASPYFNQADDAVIFRFNYSANRETFDIMRNIGGQFPLNYTKLEQIPNTKTCNQGDWYNDRTNKLFFLCLSGKNKKQYEYVEVRGVICREECDSLGDVPLEDGYRYWDDPTTWIDNKVPVEGDSPIVQGAYQVILNVNPPKLANLTILGSLIFDERRPFTKLEAERIWVRSGKLLAGNSTHPFPGEIKIVLNGEFGDNPLVIDANLDVGNKVLAVTRAMELYSTPPGTVWTRLAAYADAGATTVTVSECAGWAVGDEIVFGPSGSDPEQREKRSIASITGCAITLNQALQFDHYGAPSVTIDKPGIGQLDMRAVVGHLTRKIKIEGGPSIHGLGCRVLIYQFEEPEANLGFPRRGYTVLHGVEFNNCGQYDTQRSGLDFRNLNSDIIKTPSEVIGCSFHDTTGMLMTVQNSQYITIKNNIFFTGIKALVQINNSQYVKFQNNALIYVKKRILTDGGIANWAVFGNFVYMEELTPTQMTRDIVDVSGNVGQGSQDTGFFVMASKCSDAYQSSFYNNHCSGTILACFGVRQDPEGQCSYISGLYAHHSEVGIMYAVVSEQIQLEKSMVVENDRGISLKPAPGSIQDNKMKLNNIFISALARPDCVKCYSASLNPNCRGTMGIQMGTLSSSAFPPISSKPSSAFDTICTVQRVDLKVYLTNVEFHNFRLTYNNIPRCQDNAAFRQHHGAHDMTGQHYLVNSPCNNCEFNALLYKTRNPDQSKIGWFGGCGSFECTGQKNFLVEDQTGHFFGEIGQGIGNNTYFGPNVTYCSRQESWNGYWCPGRQATVLMFMSTAADYNKRLYSPIKLTDGLFFNEINSYAEWNWDGPEPLNLRESKFVGLITVNTVINMTNAGMNPTTSEYWLSKRSEAGSPEDWVILKWQFSVPQIIQVMVNNKVVQPGLTTHNKHHDLMTMTNQCGANNYFFENRTIHFVLTGKLDCKIRIALKNTLQVSTRLEITTSEFFGDKFLQYARAQLGGDPYNYFIIGTKKYRRRFLEESTASSVIIDWGIADTAEIGTNEGKQSQSRLAEMASKLESLGVSDELQQLGVTGLKHESTSISSISELNFKSTEQTSEIILVPGGNSNNNGQGNTNSNNNGNNNNNNNGNNNNNNNNNNNGNGNPSNNDDDLVLVTDEGVNQQDSSNNGNHNNTNPGTIQKSIKKSENSSTTVTIVVAVVCSVVGVSLLIAALLYYKKLKLAKLMAARNQKVDNEFFKANITDQQPIEAPQD